MLCVKFLPYRQSSASWRTANLPGGLFLLGCLPVYQHTVQCDSWCQPMGHPRWACRCVMKDQWMPFRAEKELN